MKPDSILDNIRSFGQMPGDIEPVRTFRNVIGPLRFGIGPDNFKGVGRRRGRPAAARRP